MGFKRSQVRILSARPISNPMFEQAFKNIDDVLWKEAGCTTELDYTALTGDDLLDFAELDAESAEVLASIRSLL